MGERTNSIGRAGRWGACAVALFAAWLLAGRERADAPPLAVPAAPPGCATLPILLMGGYERAYVNAPGTYCAQADIAHHAPLPLPHTGAQAHNRLAEIGADDVIIDLRGHTLRSDNGSGGIIARRPDEAAARSPGGSLPDRPDRITLRNGVIVLGSGNTALAFPDLWQFVRLAEAPPSGARPYRARRLVLENMLIVSSGDGVHLEGAGNVIINSIIVSKGTAAVAMAGPGGRLLNNLIVLSGPSVGDTLARRWSNTSRGNRGNRPRAALALHDADGTLVQGNTFVVERPGPHRHAVYLGEGSAGAIVHGNRFIGAPAVELAPHGASRAGAVAGTEAGAPWWWVLWPPDWKRAPIAGSALARARRAATAPTAAAGGAR